MKRVGPVASRQRALGMWVAVGIVLAAMLAAIGYAISSVLGSLHAIAHPGSGVSRPNFIFLALSAFAIGIGAATLRRLAWIGGARFVRGRRR